MKAKPTFVALALTGILGVLAATATRSMRADEPPQGKGPNTAKADAKKPKADAVTQAVARLNLAHGLVAYGREAKSPEALILAAQILGTTPIKAGDDKVKPEKPADALDRGDGTTPAKLIDEAKKMTDDETVLNMAKAVSRQIAERSRGEVDGPQEHFGSVGPNSASNWNAVFRGGELASVTVAGYGNADLDLYIFDDRGNQIRRSTGPGYNESCTWTPIYTGTFILRVVNCSPVSAGFRLYNN
jgi:hypothetical protein